MGNGKVQNHFESLQMENRRLMNELADITEARDEAMNQAFLQR